MRRHILSKSMIIISAAICLSTTAGFSGDPYAQTVIEESVDFQMWANLEMLPGGPLFGNPGEELEPMEVGVLDNDSNVFVDSLGVPIPIPVTFTITGFPEGATGQSLVEGDSVAVVYTDDFGIASATLILGDMEGAYFVSATSEFSGDLIGFRALTPGVAAYIEVEATSPCTANGIDSSTVTVTVTDFLENPVIGANIVVSKIMGMDFVEDFETIDNNDGTYTAFVTSTGADSATIAAIDPVTGIKTNTRVLFEVGPTDHIVFAATNPRDCDPMNESALFAYAADTFGNIVPHPAAEIVFATELGVVDSVAMDEGDFTAVVISTDLGVATVTATDLISGISDTLEVIFPAIYFGLPEEPTFVGSNYGLPINIFVADTARALGYYDLILSFDSTKMRFDEAIDADTLDEFAAPITEILDAGSVRLLQVNDSSMTSPTGSIDIAKLIFESIDTGMTEISVEFDSLMDTQGNLLPNTPKDKNKQKQKKKAQVCLKVFSEKWKTFVVDKEEVDEDIKDAVKIINRGIEVAKKGKKTIKKQACCACKLAEAPYYIDIIWDKKVTIFTAKDYEKTERNQVDVDDGIDEDWKLFEETKKKDERDEKCINLYYFVMDLDKGNEKLFGWTSVRYTKDDKGKIRIPLDSTGILIGDKGRDRPDNKILAHEMAHFLSMVCSAREAKLTEKEWEKQSILDKNWPNPGTPNLIEYDQYKGDVLTKEAGTDLTCDQCKKMIKKWTECPGFKPPRN